MVVYDIKLCPNLYANSMSLNVSNYHILAHLYKFSLTNHCIVLVFGKQCLSFLPIFFQLTKLYQHLIPKYDV